MDPFQSVTGRAAPLPLPNIDTDVIMPKAFLKGVDRRGLGIGAFNLLRFSAGVPNPDFILNRPGYEDCRFLVVGSNFGCGSSREHAVWGLAQLGIRALIGTSFAGIFNDNCRNNGLLTISLPSGAIAELVRTISDSRRNELAVDLANQTIGVCATGAVLGFEIEPERKRSLMRGLDPIGATLEHAADIRAFETAHRTVHPWFFQEPR